jgi:hypothetical protein
MSEHDEQEQGGAATGTAVKALAAAAATGAATYAVRRALSARQNGDEHEDEDESPESRDEPEDSAEDVDEDEQSDDDAEDEDEAEPATGTRSKLQQVTSTALASAAPALTPFVERAADSAGRYVAEHGPEIVKDHVVPQFMHAFEKAS